MTTEVFGVVRTQQYSITRPANVTAYVAGQVLADSTSAASIFKVPFLCANPSQGTILQELVVTSSANQTTKPDLEMWLFDGGTAAADVDKTAENDAASFAPTDAEMLRLITVIQIPTGTWKAGNGTAGAGGNAANVLSNLSIPINVARIANSTRSIYPIIVVRNAYTPVSGEVFQFRFKFID